MIRIIIIIAATAWLCAGTAPVSAQHDLGRLSANPHAPKSTANPASRFDPDSVTNPQGRYGSPESISSATHPYATDAPELYDGAGNYRGKLSANPYDPDSVANPYGRYGSPFSADSINNPYGAGNPYVRSSPHNPFGDGLRIIGKE